MKTLNKKSSKWGSNPYGIRVFCEVVTCNAPSPYLPTLLLLFLGVFGC